MSHEFDFIFSSPFKREATYAYEPEGQAIAVKQAQDTNTLVSRKSKYNSVYLVEEEGLTWVDVGGAKLLAADCNLDIVPELAWDTELVIISQPSQVRPDIAFGRNDHIIAAVLVEDKVFYRSPGFDLERFKEYEAHLRKNGWPK